MLENTASNKYMGIKHKSVQQWIDAKLFVSKMFTFVQRDFGCYWWCFISLCGLGCNQTLVGGKLICLPMFVLTFSAWSRHSSQLCAAFLRRCLDKAGSFLRLPESSVEFRQCTQVLLKVSRWKVSSSCITRCLFLRLHDGFCGVLCAGCLLLCLKPCVCASVTLGPLTLRWSPVQDECMSKRDQMHSHL